MRKIHLFHGIFTCALLATISSGHAQYLRDSTRFVFQPAAASLSDSIVFQHYSADETFPISLHPAFGIPEIDVSFGNFSAPLVLDFGNSGEIVLTTAIEKQVNHTITDTGYTYTPDGKIRGMIYDIMLPQFSVVGKTYTNTKAILADWKIFSTEPINGMIGLNYFGNKCMSISYRTKTFACSDRSILSQLDSSSFNIMQLETFSMHPYGLHFEGKVNDKAAIVYFDTGKNISVVNRDLVDAKQLVSDKSGVFFKGIVVVSFGDNEIKISYPRVGLLKRNIESALPVGIEVGSDILQHYLISIDRTNGNNLLLISE